MVEAQAQYWASIMYSLFISIVSWLLVDEWDKETGELDIGSEVTVYGEKFGQDINMNSFWAMVTGYNEDTLLYTVSDENEEIHFIARKDLRYRKTHTISMGHVSDDMKHDRHAMQAFTTKELDWLENKMREEFPLDIPSGKIIRLHTKSDNAGSHFKSAGSMEYYTSLADERGGASEIAYMYAFGAPKHGKCRNDGAGGMYKHRVKQDSSTAMTVGVLAHTTSGHIQDVRDVYDSLVHHFEVGTHRYRRRVVFNEHKFFLHLVADNPIHRPDETFTKLDKISEHYQFVVRNKGQMYERMRCCNCLPCVADMIEGPKDWVQSTHHIVSHVITGK